MNDATLGTLLVLFGVISDVIANIFLKKSVGFKYKKYGILSIFFILITFIFLANAIKIMELSIAYALFGAVGLLFTTAIDKLFFGIKLNTTAVCGIFIMIFGIVLLKIN